MPHQLANPVLACPGRRRPSPPCATRRTRSYRPSRCPVCTEASFHHRRALRGGPQHGSVDAPCQLDRFANPLVESRGSQRKPWRAGHRRRRAPVRPILGARRHGRRRRARAPHGRHERLRARPHRAARPDRRGARRRSAVADRADDARAALAQLGGGRRCRSTSRRPTSRTCGCARRRSPRRADRQARAHRSPGGVQIVDWRDAPVSQIYYRYEEGDDYDEELAGRRARARPRASQRDDRAQQPAPHRLPAGHLPRRARRVVQAVGQVAPLLLGGRARRRARPPRPARRRPRASSAWTRRRARRQGAPGDRGADRPRAVRSHHEPARGLVVIQGGAGSGKTTVALHRIAYLVFKDPRRSSRRVPVRGAVARAGALRRGRAAGARRRGVPVTTFRAGRGPRA